MKKLLFGLVACLSFSGLVYAAGWPGSIVLEEEILVLDNNYEASGLAWNKTMNRLLVVDDEGRVSRIDLDSGRKETTDLRYRGGRDLEGVTIIDENSGVFYVGLEHPDRIVEVRWSESDQPEDPDEVVEPARPVITGREWDLTGVLTGRNNAGLEGLTFVPNGFHPFEDSAAGGRFYVSIQRPVVPGGDERDDYLIYAFDLDLNENNRIVDWDGIPRAAGTPDRHVSDLDFNVDTGLLYVLYDDSQNRLIEMNTDGSVVNDYSQVPVPAREGVAIVSGEGEFADIYVASDRTGKVSRFSGYPVEYLEVEEERPLLLNGSFEEDGSWLKYGAVQPTFDTNEVIDGGRSMELSGAGVQQVDLPVKAGRSYRLTVSNRVLSGNLKVWFGVGSSNSAFDSRINYSYPKSEWQPFVVEIDVPENVERNGVSYVNEDGTVRDFRLVMSLSNGEGYVDGVVMEEIEEADRVLLQPVSASNWRYYGRAPFLEELVDLASSRMVTAELKSGWQHELRLVPGENYRLSYEVSVDSGYVAAHLLVPRVSRWRDFAGVVNVARSREEGFQSFTRDFVAPEERLYLRFVVSDNADVVMRNVALERI